MNSTEESRQQFEETFCLKEVVWAKCQGYPWWPAEVIRLCTPTHPVYSVKFIGEQSSAKLEPSSVRKYKEHYDKHNKKKNQKLVNAIKEANEIIAKRQKNAQQQSLRVQPKLTKKLKPVSATAKGNPVEDVSLETPASKKNGSSSESSSSGESDQESFDEVSIAEKAIEPSNSSEIIQSSLHIDREKIKRLEKFLSLCIGQPSQFRFKKIQFGVEDSDFFLLNAEELIQSHIVAKVKILGEKLSENAENHQSKHFLNDLVSTFTSRVTEYLEDTTYYDKLLQKAGKSVLARKTFEKRLKKVFIRTYLLKQETVDSLVERVCGLVSDGKLKHTKRMLVDLKVIKIQKQAKKMIISNRMSRQALDSFVETLIEVYK